MKSEKFTLPKPKVPTRVKKLIIAALALTGATQATAQEALETSPITPRENIKPFTDAPDSDVEDPTMHNQDEHLPNMVDQLIEDAIKKYEERTNTTADESTRELLRQQVLDQLRQPTSTSAGPDIS